MSSVVKSPPPPSDAILTQLREIVEAWNENKFDSVASKCEVLLKRKKTIGDLQLTVPLQMLLAQVYLQQEKWENVLKLELGEHTELQDVLLYARYRQGDYTGVLQQQIAATPTVLQQHLRAQSHYHLQHSHDVHAAYQALNEDGSAVDVLTNQVAAMVSLQAIPMVRPQDTPSCVQRAVDTLENNDNQEDEDIAHLALNIGLYQILTSGYTASGEAYLETANDISESTATATALAWSRHFWDRADEGEVDVKYPSTPSQTAFPSLSVPESIAHFNQCLISNKKSSSLPSQPHPKWNRLQTQLYWYNRALLQYRNEQYVECQESCQSLRKVTLPSASGGGKKKKGKLTNTNNIVASSSAESAWWEARIDVLLAHVLHAQSKSQEAKQKLEQRLQHLQQTQSSFTVDHAMAHVQLHQHVLSGKNETTLLKVLQSLPASIQECPALQLTLEELKVKHRIDSTSSTSSNKPKTPLQQADILFDQGNYEKACELYETALDTSSSKDDETVDAQLRYVQALALTGRTEESQSLWESLGMDDDDDAQPTLPDGESLEQKALPRSATTARLSKKLAANVVNDEGDDAAKPSRDKILRRRARKREAYLKELESKGLYNPDRPSQPNPERWIPKHERSSNRRNKGRNNNFNANSKSAQGGGSALDAQRLDVAARKAGKVPASTGPSSANIKVAGGGARGGRRR